MDMQSRSQGAENEVDRYGFFDDQRLAFDVKILNKVWPQYNMSNFDKHENYPVKWK